MARPRLHYVLLGTLIVCLAGLGGCGADQPAAITPGPAAEDSGTAVVADTGGITANGVVRPLRRSVLSFGVAGFVDSVVVQIGQRVQAGQALAALNTAELTRAVTQAEQELARARVRLRQLQAQATPVRERVAAARAAVASAQAALTAAQAHADQRSNQDIIDRAALRQAGRALADAQREYQKVLDNPTTRTWAPSSPEARALADMQEHYDVTVAQYRIHAADGSSDVAIADAEERLARAHVELYQAQHPVAAEELALAELEVDHARWALEAAEAELAQATLVAPFDGVVGTIEVGAGDWAAAGARVVELLDVTGWRVETRNVGELQIGRVQAGQEVRVRVNAFRDEELHGRVATISPVAIVQQGDTTYTLMIELEPTALNLRPGMTAQVEILIE